MKAFIYIRVCFSCGVFSTAIKLITFGTQTLQKKYSLNLNGYRSAIVVLFVLYVVIEVFKFVIGN